MIRTDSYQTCYGQNTHTKPIVQAITEAMIRDYISTQSIDMRKMGDFNPIFVIGIGTSEKDIPLFAHPINVFYKGENYVVSDLRMILSAETVADRPNDDEYLYGRRIRNRTEYEFIVVRQALQLHWMANPKSAFASATRFAAVAYAETLTAAIARFAALEIEDQYRLKAVLHYFYQLLHIEKTPTEDELEKMTIHTIKATGLPAAEVDRIFAAIEKSGGFKDIHDLCEKLGELVSIRLKGFSFATLLTLVANAWYGINAKEIIAVSLEHPPTWVAIARTSLAHNTYKSTAVYRTVERLGRSSKHGLPEFITNIAGLVQETGGRCD